MGRRDGGGGGRGIKVSRRSHRSLSQFQHQERVTRVRGGGGGEGEEERERTRISLRVNEGMIQPLVMGLHRGAYRGKRETEDREGSGMELARHGNAPRDFTEGRRVPHAEPLCVTRDV
jgi:hypothetical protein